METVSVYEAKADFSQLLRRAEDGECIIVSRHGRPIAQIGPVVQLPRPVVVGDLAGAFVVPDDFDDWTQQDEQDWFGE